MKNFLARPALMLAAFLLASTTVSAQTPPAASVSVQVSVPSELRWSPFDSSRFLTVPPNFAVSVYARVSSARFLLPLPNGDLLVSRPNSGNIEIVRPGVNGAVPSVTHFVSGLRLPHDMSLHTIDGVTYLYFSESHQISRAVYVSGDAVLRASSVVVGNLPDASSSELGGSYGHQLKNFALDSNHKLYVSIASATNSSPSDTVSDPIRNAIYQYNADGTGRRLFARGLRNAEGLALVPGTTTLWAAVNNRDNTAYPFHGDWDGDGRDDYGRVMQSYVDNHPTEEFTRVRDGGNYGWPFANPNPDTAAGMDNLPFDLDVQNNPDGSHGSAASFDRISKGIQAHSAPLGLLFLQDTAFPALYKSGAVIALHGSWNRSVKTGYKVAYFPWNAQTQTPGVQQDLIAGWADAQSEWGRPVDMAVGASGELFVSDDASGTIYKLTYTPPPAALSALTLAPNVIASTQTTLATVTLTNPAPTGGLRAALSSGGYPLGEILVPADSRMGTKSLLAGATGNFTIDARLGGVTKSAAITVLPAPATLAFRPQPVRTGASVTGTVTLSGPAPSGGVSVTITSGTATLGRISIAAGQSSGTITLTAGAPGSYSIRAVLNGVTQTAPLVVSR